MKYKVRQRDFTLYGEVASKPLVRIVTTANDEIVLERASFADYPAVEGVRDGRTGAPVKDLAFVVGIENLDEEYCEVDVRTVRTADSNWRP